jgi:GntR family transcriptional regulator of vanillate catabolism
MEQRMKPGQRVVIALRKMIASGELADGQRIAEIPTAERLGVSRMPVRTALRTLEQEGLVTRLGARGYAARGPTEGQISDAIEVRGVLEGLAARIVASKSNPPAFADKLKACLAEGEAIFAKGYLEEPDLERFYRYNLAFHDLLIATSGNQAIAYGLFRNNHLPFASAAALAFDLDDLPANFRLLAAAHQEHVAVSNAILSGNGDEAELLMRQHARAPLANGTSALRGTL